MFKTEYKPKGKQREGVKRMKGGYEISKTGIIRSEVDQNYKMVMLRFLFLSPTADNEPLFPLYHSSSLALG